MSTQPRDSAAQSQVLDEELYGGLECTLLSSFDLGVALQALYEQPVAR